MIFSLYRGKTALVIIVGALVTVSLVAAAGFYFVENRAANKALQEKIAEQEGESTAFQDALSGDVSYPQWVDEQSAQNSSEGEEDSSSGFQSPPYLVPGDGSGTDTDVTDEDGGDDGNLLDDDEFDFDDYDDDYDNDVYRLEVKDGKLYTPGGSELIPRGFSWGAWGTHQDGDAGRNVDEGANMVRIPLRWWGIYSEDTIDSRNDDAPGHINPDHLDELDRMVKEASAAHLWIDLFIDSDCGQNGTQEGGTKDYCDLHNDYGSAGHNFWTDRAMRTKFFEVWKFIADRYKDTPYIAMYELLPEPNPTTFTSADISTFYQELIEVVHPIDPRTPFLIGGRSYITKQIESSYIDTELPIIYTGNMFVHMDKGSYEEIVYDLQYRLKQMTDFRTKHHVPVYSQQLGVESVDDPGEVYAAALLSTMNASQTGWAWWEYRQHNNNEGGYGVWYEKKAGWFKKDTVLNVISQYLKQ